MIGKKCECEARVRAFIRMLRVGEGTGELIKSYDYNKKETIYIAHDSQKGYTTAFNNNKIEDLSTHPQKNYDGSTAAGAYQVMRYTWWWLNGEDLDENNKKTGVYNVKHDYIKKYAIPDFGPESQDKICVALMIAQRPTLIDKIIKNDIVNAIQKDACFIWASLPESNNNSHYNFKGKPQPATPLKLCIEHYDKFLEEELNGNSCLHLKTGFLKIFGYNCCNDDQKDVDCSCGKKHIDLRNQIEWKSQFDSQWGDKKAQKVACWKASQQILTNSGLGKTSGYSDGAIQLAKEIDQHTKMSYLSDGLNEGIKYIDEQLENEVPILVGVNHDLNYRGEKNNDQTTDHFVVIVGRGCDKDGSFYYFYEVGTSYKQHGASDENKLYILSNRIEGKTSYNTSKLYQIAQVRKNK